MTPETNPLARAQAAIAGIVEAGGPKFPEWCDLRNELIIGVSYNTQYEDSLPSPNVDDDLDTYCPPACEAAVIAYAGEVTHWWAGPEPMDLRIASVRPSPAQGAWRWSLFQRGSAEIFNDAPTQFLAALALLEAVAEAVSTNGGK